MNIIVKRKPKTNKLKKPFKNSDLFKPKFNKHFLHNEGWQFYFVNGKRHLKTNKLLKEKNSLQFSKYSSI